jgi:hypothetical protein
MSKSEVVLHHVSSHFVVMARSRSTFFSCVDCGKWYCPADALPEFMD